MSVIDGDRPPLEYRELLFWIGDWWNLGRKMTKMWRSNFAFTILLHLISMYHDNQPKDQFPTIISSQPFPHGIWARFHRIILVTSVWETPSFDPEYPFPIDTVPLATPRSIPVHHKVGTIIVAPRFGWGKPHQPNYVHTRPLDFNILVRTSYSLYNAFIDWLHCDCQMSLISSRVWTRGCYWKSISSCLCLVQTVFDPHSRIPGTLCHIFHFWNGPTRIPHSARANQYGLKVDPNPHPPVILPTLPLPTLTPVPQKPLLIPSPLPLPPYQPQPHQPQSKSTPNITTSNNHLIQMSKLISVLVVFALMATMAFSFDVGNCNSCPGDCDVTYMAIGGDVIASYSCISYSWRMSGCSYATQDATCSSNLWRVAECYSSKRGVSSDSKCSGTKPANEECSSKLGCEDGSTCKNDTCVPLKPGQCAKDSDCDTSEKPYCSGGGKCVATPSSGQELKLGYKSSSNLPLAGAVVAVAIVGSIFF